MAMRTIPVSTDVYAAIWQSRQPGEETEEDILRRILNVSQSEAAKHSEEKKIAFADPKNGVQLDEGFEIFRIYKGKEYRAYATNGTLVRKDNGVAYNSLHQLSRSVSGNMENAWNNWYYIDQAGKRALIQTLRKNPAIRFI